jgi:predicted DNA-binding mobile mystery protein A
MTRSRRTTHARSQLDQRFRQFGSTKRYTPPVRGWIKAIREALGMSSAQLARRLKIKQPSVVDLEKSEAKGSIELATLRRVAEALDCTLVYALVPNKPLDTMVRERARAFMRKRQQQVDHSMLLENQKVPKKAASKNAAARLEEVVRATRPSLFWD